jgi:uncharacterized small protein (DUF1192 family)
MMDWARMTAAASRNRRDDARNFDMALEDDAPPLKRRRLEPLLLDSLGIEELRLYISELKTEITRVEADIDRKQGHRSAADAFFKRS